MPRFGAESVRVFEDEQRYLGAQSKGSRAMAARSEDR